MRKIINKITIVALAILTFGCSDPENAIYEVFDNFTYGSAVRTIERGNQIYNVFDTDSFWEIKVEVQDEEKGNLLSELNVYVSFKDNFEDATDNSKPEILYTTIPASEFSASENGLPSTDIKVTMGEALAALGISSGQYNGADAFTFRLEVKLTDGRSFSAADASGTLEGSYFDSPYQYRAQILCFPDVPYHGNYVLNLKDSFGDGWNGGAIRVTLNGVSTDYTIDSGSSASYTVNVPTGSTSLDFEYISGAFDSEVSFKITAPSGTTAADISSPSAGPIGLFLCDESND